MTIAYLGLGSNLGDSQQTLRDAIVCLAQYSNILVLHKASIYLSAPVDTHGPDFLNTVISVQTTLSAKQLHVICQQIEHQFERQRPYRYAPRTLDIDLLLFGDEIITTPELIIPHPRMTERAFVLLPLAEIAPNIVIPHFGEIQPYLTKVTQQTINKLSPVHCFPTCAH